MMCGVMGTNCWEMWWERLQSEVCSRSTHASLGQFHVRATDIQESLLGARL